MLNGQYVGCTTGFSQSDKTDIFIPNQKVETDTTPYLQRLEAVKLILVQQTTAPLPSETIMYEFDYEGNLVPVVVNDFSHQPTIQIPPTVCTPIASEWSRPITWEMVNKPAQNGGVTVDLGAVNYWINLQNINTIDEFFVDLIEQSQNSTHFIINTRKNSDGSMSVQYAPRTSSMEGTTAVPNLINQHGEFYVYDPSNIGNNAESIIYLADAFDNPPSFTACLASVTHEPYINLEI